MPYYKESSTDCSHLAELVVRHNSGQYYDVADRLAKHLCLSPRDRLRLRRRVKHLIEGGVTYLQLEE